jgi:hypothetical protein
MLERAGADPQGFGCAAPAPAPGDPCVDTEAYYRGPVFPPELVARVGEHVQAVKLDFEHSSLQAVRVEFKPGVDPDAIRAAHRVPASEDYPPEYPNLMSVGLSLCAADHLCLVLQGFDHMGAGDVECPAVAE